MTLKNNATVFIISVAVSIITLGYVGFANVRNGCPANINSEFFPLFIPLLYGIFGVLNYYVTQNFGNGYSFLVGMLFGLLLSMLGRFMLNLPTKIFNFTDSNQWMVHIHAMVLYAGIFQLIITPLTKYIVV